MCITMLVAVKTKQFEREIAAKRKGKGKGKLKQGVHENGCSKED